MSNIEKKPDTIVEPEASSATKSSLDEDKEHSAQDVHAGFRVRVELLGPEWSRAR